MSITREGLVDENIEHKDELDFGNHQLKIIHTLVILPGRSFYLRKRVLFTGDTLFKGSIGRTDLPGGDFQQILESIRGRILIYRKIFKLFRAWS